MTFPITFINKASSFSNSLPSPTSQLYDYGGEGPLSIPNLSHTKHLSATLHLFNTSTRFGQVQEYCQLNMYVAMHFGTQKNAMKHFVLQ